MPSLTRLPILLAPLLVLPVPALAEDVLNSGDTAWIIAASALGLSASGHDGI